MVDLLEIVQPCRGRASARTATAHELVTAEPLEGKCNGAGRQAFDQFKARADGITRELNSSLAAILGGQSGMESAFSSGDQEQGENARQQMGAANFDAARFR